MVQKKNLVERKERPRKVESDVVCKSLGRGSSTAVGEVVDPLNMDLGDVEGQRFKISILNKISIVSCNILKQSVLASTNRVLDFERWMSTCTEFAVCLIYRNLTRIHIRNSERKRG